MFKLCLFLSLVVAAKVYGAPTIISPKVLRSVNSETPVDILVTVAAPIRQVLSTLSTLHFVTRGQRLTYIANALKSHTASTQQPILEFLSKVKPLPSEIKPFWITNKIFIKDADAGLIQDLAARSDVSAITENRQYSLIRPIEAVTKKLHFQNDLEWGLKMIDVQKVWDAGYNGTGVRVGGLDTGVRHTHKSLVNNFAADYNWFDVIKRTKIPIDPNGHGTHITGTIVGSGGIGVAPGAEWVHCRAMDARGRGNEDQFIACGEWFACPTLPDGSEPNCEKAPNLVSNSWAFAEGGMDFMDDVISTWVAGNIVPIFAVGNYGPSCESMKSPSDSVVSVVAVGATTIADEISSFSSSGPSYFGQVKPDIVAPGSDVRSASNIADDAYETFSGTSMATPHVAGVVALLVSSNEEYTYDEIKDRLYSGATHTVPSTKRNCGGIPETTYPNNHVGHGRLSASASVLG